MSDKSAFHSGEKSAFTSTPSGVNTPHAAIAPLSQALPAVHIQRAKVAPPSLQAHEVLYLQHTIGNRAVNQLLRANTTRPTIQRKAGETQANASRTNEPSPAPVSRLGGAASAARIQRVFMDQDDKVTAWTSKTGALENEQKKAAEAIENALKRYQVASTAKLIDKQAIFESLFDLSSELAKAKGVLASTGLVETLSAELTPIVEDLHEAANLEKQIKSKDFHKDLDQISSAYQDISERVLRHGKQQKHSYNPGVWLILGDLKGELARLQSPFRSLPPDVFDFGAVTKKGVVIDKETEVWLADFKTLELFLKDKGGVLTALKPLARYVKRNAKMEAEPSVKALAQEGVKVGAEEGTKEIAKDEPKEKIVDDGKTEITHETEKKVKNKKVKNKKVKNKKVKKKKPFQDKDWLTALKDGLREVELKAGFQEQIYVPLGLLPAKDFFALMTEGHMLDDYGAGQQHGELTHRLQWNAIITSYNLGTLKLHAPPVEVYKKMNTGKFAFPRSGNSIWGRLLDKEVKVSEDNYSYPGTLNRDLQETTKQFDASGVGLATSKENTVTTRPDSYKAPNVEGIKFIGRALAQLKALRTKQAIATAQPNELQTNDWKYFGVAPTTTGSDYERNLKEQGYTQHSSGLRNRTPWTVLKSPPSKLK